MRERKLSEKNLLTTEEAAARREVNARTILRWVDAGILPVFVVRLGERHVYLFETRDVDGATPRRPGAPAGNTNRRGKVKS